MATLRFADPETVQEYPFTVSAQPVVWQAREGGWLTEVVLPEIRAGSILAPSLSVLGAPDYGFEFALIDDGTRVSLPPVPFKPDAASSDAAGSPHNTENQAARRSGGGPAGIETVIDCYHLHETLSNARLLAFCTVDPRALRFLLTVSVRQLKLTDSIPPPAASACTRPPPMRSQMLENPRISARACSPVSTAMVLEHHLRDRFDETARHLLTRQCLDHATGMYGLWPLAIRAASFNGCPGAVELFSGWEPVLKCLTADLPVVASIRYTAGKLPGAAIDATGGHLVVVHGIEGDEVLVNDPAAATHSEVNRRYPLGPFGEAWFRYRGAAYILLPCAT